MDLPLSKGNKKWCNLFLEFGVKNKKDEPKSRNIFEPFRATSNKSICKKLDPLLFVHNSGILVPVPSISPLSTNRILTVTH